jgi:plasmid stability protein
MAQLLVRNVPDEIADALRRRANANKRSVEAEHRIVLEEVLKAGNQDFWTRAAEIRTQMGKLTGDSADLIREDRDRR